MTEPNADRAAVDVHWIAARASDPAVSVVEVDVSPAAYSEGHIPGAVLWNAYSDLRDANYMPIDGAELQGLFSRSGISPETCVITYGYGAPLGYWLLNAYGHENTRVLEGRRDQWLQAGHDWSTDSTCPAERSYPAVAQRADLVADREAVEAAIDDPEVVLLDVRSQPEYAGERFWPSGATQGAGRAGHLPGAVNVPIDAFRAADGTRREPGELQTALEQAGVTKDKTVVTYCTIGNRASEAWFALTQLLGYPDARVYYGSWVEWGKAPDTAIET